MSRLSFFLLGPPRIERNEEPINIGRRRATALAVYLAVTGRRHGRGSLAALFWPEHDRRSARAGLRRALSLLRKGLGTEWLDTDWEQVAMSQTPDLWVDVHQFQQRITVCEKDECASFEPCSPCLTALAEAVGLYHDDFLSGFGLPDSECFNEWQFFQSEMYRNELIGALKQLSYCHRDRQSFDRAIHYVRRWLTLDPLNETAHCHLMQLYAQMGERTAALRQYQACVRLLDEKAGLHPAPETVQVHETIKAARPPSSLFVSGRHSPSAFANGGQTGRSRRSSPTANRTTIPPGVADTLSDELSRHNVTPFLGREAELSRLSHLLSDPHCRLITLTGLGGMGKTRLACRAAVENMGTFADGVYFMPLASATTANFVPTIARLLGLSLNNSQDVHKGENAKSQLCQYLCHRNVLLVMDGFEHLLDRTEVVAYILRHTSAVKIMATSRQRLHLREEWLLEIQGLAYPQDIVNDKVRDYEAVQLFLKRAQQVHPNFSLGQGQAWIVRLCQLVEGMPLGIELAASWASVLPCREIVREARRNLNFLTTSIDNVPERHRSLQKIFDHSWDVLLPEERKALRKLSVFPQWFAWQAANQVADVALSLLSTLVSKSLLYRNEEGTFRMHRMLRQYADEKLSRKPEEQEAVQEAYEAYRQLSVSPNTEGETLAY